MGDILSQDEIDALLSATEESDGGGGGGGDPGGGEMGGGGLEEASSNRIVTSYDFKHPARVNKDQLRTLENLHDNFARLLSSTFSGAMRAVVDVDTAFVDQTTYAEFIMSLSNPSCSYQFTLGPTNGQAIIDFAMPVVFAFVDRIFGGKGSSQGVDARQLSQIEMGVIAKIVKRVVEDLETTWESILRVEISDIELETNPEFMQITASSEIVILLAFEVNSTNASGLVSLCYPFFTLESILPRLGQQTYVRQGRQNRDETIRQNRQRLTKTYMPIVAELAAGRASFQELQDLQVGDVLKLETEINEPTIIYVAGEPKFLGRPGRVGRRNAVQIISQIDHENEEIHKNRSREIPVLDSTG
jgi:flagellar motor switch protein FliM